MWAMSMSTILGGREGDGGIDTMSFCERITDGEGLVDHASIGAVTKMLRRPYHHGFEVNYLGI